MNSTPFKEKGQKWYKNDFFPLVPLLRIDKRNKRNAGGFSFQWLFIKVWSLDHIEFELSFVASTHWGIGMTAIIPYIRLIACLPCPEKIGMWLDEKTNRAPEIATVDELENQDY